MSPEERLKIQSGSFDPASIITISSSDFSYVGTGSVSISSSATAFFGISATSEFAWRIQGVVESGLESSWRVGDGEYYWFRVEGECGKVECDTFGVQNRNCNRMTFTTVVAARDVAEVCEVMTSPVLNPPVQAKIISIRKYSRPIARTGPASSDCNILDDEEFCQIPECEDYCLDQRIVNDIGFRSFAIESIYAREMSGGVNLSGSADNNSKRSFDPSDVLLQLSGSSDLYASYFYTPYFSISMMELSIMSVYSLEMSGSAEINSNARAFDMYGGAVLSGGAQFVSPVWNYPNSYLLSLETESGDEILSEDGSLTEFEHSSSLPVLDIVLGGGATIGYLHIASGGLMLEGGSDSIMRLNHDSFVSLEIGGSITDLISSGFYYQPSSGGNLSGEAELGFEDIGIISTNIQVASSVFDLGYDFNPVNYESQLTISDSFVVSACGCSSAGLSLEMFHNLFESKFLSSFMDRNGLVSPTSSQMRYRSLDSSWRNVHHYSGTLDSGGYGKISTFFSLDCVENSWRFSFVVKNSENRAETKFICDIPSDLVCGSNDISTEIELQIRRRTGQPTSGQSIYVVTPHSVRPGPYSAAEDLSVFVGGMQNQYMVYYDELGVFGDSYWLRNPLRFRINSASPGYEMQVMNLKQIF